VRAQAHQDDEASIDLVGNMPRKQGQQQKWQELGKTDEAEIEHAAGDVIHLPAHGHDDHLGGDGGAKPRAQKQREVAIHEHREAARAVPGTQERG
jgi:hypothetical protein